jgi:hypothetical protein
MSEHFENNENKLFEEGFETMRKKVFKYVYAAAVPPSSALIFNIKNLFFAVFKY